MRHSTHITLDAESSISEGLVTVHDDARKTGHVTIYTPVGSISISSEDVDTLRDLASSLDRAANRLANHGTTDVDTDPAVIRTLAIATGSDV